MELTPEQREEYEERAAILEYDAHLDREMAETRAMAIVINRTRDSTLVDGCECSMCLIEMDF